MAGMLGVVYDLHGNLAALEALLDEAETEGVERWLVGGDIAAFGPWPKETLARVRELPNATFVRGNADRWVRGEPDFFGPGGPLDTARRLLSSEEIDWLHGLPTSAELDGILYVHGSPLADDESFPPEPSDDDERLLTDVRDRTIVFGHSHQQFRRPGPNGTDLINPGSVGMPLDGDVRAAWATWDGDFTFRRTEYEVGRALTKLREYDGDWVSVLSERIEFARPASSE
jgi:predicted phosphodiesterase